MPDWSLALFFLLIAFVYASVGFGGGSSYLAVLALAALPFSEIRLTALVCNIIVVSGGTLIYWQHKQLDFRKILPLVIASVPMAFLGSKMRISEAFFFKTLGISLLAAAILLWVQPSSPRENAAPQTPRPLREAGLGGGIGFLSGMVGIGGGIFLSPLLHFFRWDTARKIAATASLFILVNSIAGIAGQLASQPAPPDWGRIALLASSVFVGGQAGSRISLRRFDLRLIRRLTAVLVFVAGVEVLIKHGH